MTNQGFPERVYAQAADAYRESCVEKTLKYPRAVRYVPVRHPAVGGPGNERDTKQHELWAHELAFNTLKFQALLEDVLTDSCFQAAQHLPDDLMALAMVMLYDLQDRKFQPRLPMTGNGEGPVEEVRLVEDSLFRFRTKLAASLARFRIKQDLVCIDDILPTCVKEKHQRKHLLPTCAWVNTLKSSIDEVCVTLKTQGFIQVLQHTHLEEKKFCQDTHCPDVLLFPHQAQDLLDRTTLLMDHMLIIQEKSRSLAVSALHPLLAKNTDILIVGSFSAHTVAHVGVQASVLSNNVYVCGLPADSAPRQELQTTLSHVGCKNVRLLSEQFAELSEGDSRLQKVRVVLVLPRCTASALTDPVAHIIHENGDRTLLQGLSQGTVSEAKLKSLVQKQTRDLSYALTFPKVHSVVYCTCSVYAEENELVVKRALRNTAARSHKLWPFRIVSTRPSAAPTDEGRVLRPQAPTGTDEGCFLCVLKREAVETVQNILERAAAKGLLSGLALPEKVKKTSAEAKQSGAPAPPPPPHEPSLSGDPRVPEQLHTHTAVPGGASEHTHASRCASPAPNNPSDPQSHGSAREQPEKQTSRAKRKKGRRRKVWAVKNGRRVKTKPKTKRKTPSSRQKPV